MFTANKGFAQYSTDNGKIVPENIFITRSYENLSYGRFFPISIPQLTANAYIDANISIFINNPSLASVNISHVSAIRINDTEQVMDKFEPYDDLDTLRMKDSERKELEQIKFVSKSKTKTEMSRIENFQMKHLLFGEYYINREACAEKRILPPGFQRVTTNIKRLFHLNRDPHEDLDFYYPEIVLGISGIWDEKGRDLVMYDYPYDITCSVSLTISSE